MHAMLIGREEDLTHDRGRSSDEDAKPCFAVRRPPPMIRRVDYVASLASCYKLAIQTQSDEIPE